jgi:molybdopterin-guanine dinucleotide biosynthesis protein A
LPVYIVSGGRSSRFGSDKARALSHGKPLVCHVADALTSRASHITVVADRDDKYADLGLRTIGDRTPGHGPLSGLDAALADCSEDGWLLLVSCDWVGLQAEWITALTSRIGAGARAVAFRGERWEPLFALYHTALGPHVQSAVAQDKGPAAWRLLEDVGAIAVPLPTDWHRAVQVNTPDALP